jgi:hypothetical protein
MIDHASGFFHEIWFRLPERAGVLSVKVQAVSMDYPQKVWDSLAENFEMVSARP